MQQDFPTSTATRHPRVGMLATVRNRRGLIASVEPFDAGPDGRLHLVRVEYTDPGGVAEDTVLWEREQGRDLLEPQALPRVGEEPPMPGGDFDALVRAARWNALAPFLGVDDPEERSTTPIAAPFFGAVQVDDFQLVPLLKALQMPRVSLLLADDVGLGKTVEAGLVLTELLLRRRIRRVLVLCPASLRQQWLQEMRDKFSLSFDLVDRIETHALKKRLGLDANPWRTFPRVIASYQYLRQPDVLEDFLATCRPDDSATQQAQLPWDLLIVDEAHNLTPARFGDDSELAKMLRAITPWFEHKLFLTATPHNGHTRCFTGLLEQLDPVRFRRTSELTQQERAQIEEIVVRRLKREINELDDGLGRPRRFADRFLEPEPLYFQPRERALSSAFETFRQAVKRLIASSQRGEQLAGNFAIEVLNKRLLSCPSTFAESWYRFKRGLAEDEAASDAEVAAARRASEEEIDDDLEREGRAHHAARTVGAWLKPFLERLAAEVAAIDQALLRLGIEPAGDGLTAPVEDARFDRLVDLIERRLRTPRGWGADERLIVFTEYKTTLDDLARRLRARFEDRGRAIRVLYGTGAGMTAQDRDEITRAFNDPADPVRVLIATDAASEGLNLQETARDLLHYEIPWNPARLEQRNGRLDRHGQARDVFVYHFVSEDDADLRFIAHVVNKVHEIREDLGSMGEIFDAAFERRFADLEDADRLIGDLDRDLATAAGRGAVPRPVAVETGVGEAEELDTFCRAIDLSPATLRDTLEVALGIGFGQPRLEGPDDRGRMKLAAPLPPRWELLIDDTLRLDGAASRGPLPGLVFDPRYLLRQIGDRVVFRHEKDTTLLHLGHPLFRHALAVFARQRFPGAGDEAGVSRWLVRHGRVPPGAAGLLLLTVEELAVNELREPFHHWVRTLRLPLLGAGGLGDLLPWTPPTADPPVPTAASAAAVARARELWDEVAYEVQSLLRTLSQSRTAALERHLEEAGAQALADEKERFRLRLAEVERSLRESSLRKLEEERERLLAELRQGHLFAPHLRDREEELRDLEEELRRRQVHDRDLREQLQRERSRVIERLLPRRYRLRGPVQVFPVSVEIRLRETAS